MTAARRDRVLVGVLRSGAFVSGIVVLLIFAFLLLESIPALRGIGSRFFTDSTWNPAPVAAEGEFNLLPMLYGTLLATFGAVLLATPLGLLSAIFCHEYAPPVVASVYRRSIELLAGIPSVVYGLWGLMVVVPLIREVQPPGASLLAGVIVLTIMILPTIALIADAALAGVPVAYRRSAAALGLSRWTTLRGVILPAARSGLLTGVILETGRAIGETMAILMVCGNVVKSPSSIFDPIRTLTANIALEMGYAAGDHRAALFVSGLILLVLVAGLVVVAELIDRGRIHG